MAAGIGQKLRTEERNHGIDLLRGLCLVCIIFNHTCFNSGDTYVPPFLAQFSMLIDVPALFFVSGMTYRYIGRDILIGSLLKLSLSFTMVALLFNFADRSLTLKTILMPLFLQNLSLPKAFHCLQVSYWFVPLYVSVLILATIILQKLKDVYLLIAVCCLSTYFIAFFFHLDLFDFYCFGTRGQHVLFYLALFLLGYFYKDKIWQDKYKNLWASGCVLTAVCVYVLTYITEGNFVFNVMLNKFPPRLPYLALSFVSVGFFMWLYQPQRHNKLLEHIGKNALFYYIGQGIGASLLYYVVGYVMLPVYIKLPLMFMLNLFLTALSAEVFKFMYEGIGAGYRKIVRRSV